MSGDMTVNGGNAGFRGCSSMAEQKLPKLLTSAKNSHPTSKTSSGNSVSIQIDRIRAQNKFHPQRHLVGWIKWCGIRPLYDDGTVGRRFDGGAA